MGLKIRRGPSRFLALVLAAVFFTVTMPPALSQLPELAPTTPSSSDIIVPEPTNPAPVLPDLAPADSDFSEPPRHLLPESLSAEQLVQRAADDYVERNYLGSAEKLREAIKQFEARGDHELQLAISLGNLSLAYQHLGQWDAGATAIIRGFELLGVTIDNSQAQITDSSHPQVIARLLDIYGRLNYVQGNPEDALVNWRQEGEIYDHLEASAPNIQISKQFHRQWLTSRLNQVQAQQTLGRHLQSCITLTDSLDLNTQETLLDCQNDGHASFVRESPDFKALVARVKETVLAYQLTDLEETSIWQGLGAALRVLGRLEDSREVLEEGLTLATKIAPSTETIARAKHFHNLPEEADEKTTPSLSDLLSEGEPLLMPLYLSLGNTLTALGELERDRKNSRYENAKSFSTKFGCFVPKSEKPKVARFGEEIDEDDTVAEFYQRAALCYRDAVQQQNVPSNLFALQAKLNQLSLSIEHLKWLVEDLPTIGATDQPIAVQPMEDQLIAEELATEDIAEQNTADSTTRELGIGGVVREQSKRVETQLSRLDCLMTTIEDLPVSQAKVYARLNLARNLLKYLEVQLSSPYTNINLSQLLPADPEQALTTPPALYANACEVGKTLSVERFADLEQTGGQSLWSDITHLLSMSRQEAQELYQRTETIVFESNRDALNSRLLGNKRLESLAVGNLGNLYETLGRLYAQRANPLGKNASQDGLSLIQKAQLYTLEALELGQPDKAPDIAYRWQWQLGRLLVLQGPSKRDQAIGAYQTAVTTLEKARKNLSTIDSEAQFSFRDNVEPVYRELIELLLQPAPGEGEPRQANLKAAIAEIGSLQLAELENFLRCNVPGLTPVEEIRDSNAAIIHTILSNDHLTIVLKLPNQKDLKAYSVAVSKQEVENTVEKLFQLLSTEEPYEARQEADKVYQWLIDPLRSDLNKAFAALNSNRKSLDSNTSQGTLVFVMDSVLRKTPLAFLKHNDRYLIEDYAIALAPRQEVFQPSLAQAPLSVFIGGIGIRQTNLEGENFAPIQFLRDEFQAIKKTGVSISEPLLDKEFTFKNIQEKLLEKSYTAMHIKTHSQFSSNPNKTFIAAFNQLIKANELRNLIQTASQRRGEPLDLLVLSACSSAQGDDRAILGLAGIATLTGTRSTVSALWPAFDRFNTEFMRNFYTELVQNGSSKAEALRKAQLMFIRQGEPAAIWANYVLVGNWL
ncbi:CHAT domain-containing protein [Leptolyngbya cf. ectocarpi LEGE 11479]|uniref:CHAT domain-containing protein n=1 Tax=Leptolyngbya cf. ectocarpi LEGE 11479 TaxID=1828722 RepID=A0A928ZWB7_LEPEC|nr:CHAT domain-containing protein [Leptolyngbya ectocarpi]MBE9068650.1 CHAT domain-containing protein [Leptolyngbya cf. ectocarpi LEGE 11479]